MVMFALRHVQSGRHQYGNHNICFLAIFANLFGTQCCLGYLALFQTFQGFEASDVKGSSSGIAGPAPLLSGSIDYFCKNRRKKTHMHTIELPHLRGVNPGPRMTLCSGTHKCFVVVCPLSSQPCDCGQSA